MKDSKNIQQLEEEGLLKGKIKSGGPRTKIIYGDLISHDPINEKDELIVEGKISAPGIKCGGLKAKEIFCQGDLLIDGLLDCDGDIFASGSIECDSQISAGGNIISKQFIKSYAGIEAGGNIIAGRFLQAEEEIKAGEFIVAENIEAGEYIIAEFGIFSLGDIQSGNDIEGGLFIVSLKDILPGMMENGEHFSICGGFNWGAKWGKIVARYASGLREEDIRRFVEIRG